MNEYKNTTRPVLYTRRLCSWCQDAKRFLRERGIAFDEVDVGHDRAAYEAMKKLSGQRYVPVLVMNGRLLANFDVGQLEKFLAEANGGTVIEERGQDASRDS